MAVANLFATHVLTSRSPTMDRELSGRMVVVLGGDKSRPMELNFDVVGGLYSTGLDEVGALLDAYEQHVYHDLALFRQWIAERKVYLDALNTGIIHAGDWVFLDATGVLLTAKTQSELVQALDEQAHLKGRIMHVEERVDDVVNNSQ